MPSAGRNSTNGGDVEAPRSSERVSLLKKIDKSGPLPVFLQNPDGSYLQGCPPGYKEKTPPRSPRSNLAERQQRLLEFGDDWDVLSNTMAEEYEFIYARHQQLFGFLLLMEFAVDVAYNIVFVFHGHTAVQDVYELYEHTVKMRTLEITFWSMFVADALYGVAYYALAVAALWTGRPRIYKIFITWCIVGIAAQVLLAYINKFNLLVFFLRLLAYIYAKFLRNLALSMSFVPRLNANNGAIPPGTPPSESDAI